MSRINYEADGDLAIGEPKTLVAKLVSSLMQGSPTC